MDRSPEPTIFSLSDEVPEPQGFAAYEAAFDGQAEGAVLARGAVGELCSVRKLSRRGAVLHTDTPVSVGQHLSFELMNGRAIGGTVSWVRGTEVILRFAADLDVLGVVAAELASQPGERRRMPRIELDGVARLRIGPRVVDAALVDISPGGVKLALGAALDPGAAATLELPGFRPLAATLRWCEGGRAGLLFDRELGWQEMMPWLRARPVASTPRTAPAPSTPSAPAAALAPSVELNIPARIREGATRWNVAVVAISPTHATFESFTRPRFGTLISIVLPGLQGTPARVTGMEGDRWTCEFAAPLHPAVVDRMRAGGR